MVQWNYENKFVKSNRDISNNKARSQQCKIR